MINYHELQHYYPGIAHYIKVNVYADLPIAEENIGEIYVILNATGIFGINRKRKGLWYCNGVTWERLGIAPTLSDLSFPPSGKYRLINLYFDALEDEYVIIHSSNPES